MLNTPKDALKYVKLTPFAADFMNRNAMDGLYHRVNGKSTQKDTKSALTSKDLADFKEAFTQLGNQLIQLANSIESDDLVKTEAP